MDNSGVNLNSCVKQTSELWLPGNAALQCINKHVLVDNVKLKAHSNKNLIFGAFNILMYRFSHKEHVKINLRLKLHFWGLLYSNSWESGAHVKMQLDKAYNCDIQVTTASHKLPALLHSVASTC